MSQALLLRTALVAAALLAAQAARAQISFYENEGFRGRVFSSATAVDDFTRYGFNDRASSVVVERGRWEVCEDSRYGGRCAVLSPGSYDRLSSMGLNDRLSSMRPVTGRGSYANAAPPPAPAPDYPYRQRANERLYEANVDSVHAVMGAPTQRCWVEREAVRDREQPNVGRAVIGALLGGVIGHQIGGGTGRDVATAGGAVAGAVIGANTGPGRGNDGGAMDVRRCQNTPNEAPAYWDVGYNFRGVQHQVQMHQAPGATITVNRQGEPRQ